MEILALLLKIKSRSSRVGPGKRLARGRMGVWGTQLQEPSSHIEDSPSPWRGLKTTMMVPGEGALHLPSHAGPKHLPG